jgi:hypothetical protein
MMTIRWQRPKRGIKPHVKEMRVKTSRVGIYYDNFNFERLNQGVIVSNVYVFSWNGVQIMKVKKTCICGY